MGAARRLTVAAVGLVALATVGGAAFSVVALSTSTDAAFRERSHPSSDAARPAGVPTVAGTEAARPASSTAPLVTVTPEPLAIRARREPLMIFGLVRSAGVIERMIAVTRSKCLSSSSASWSFICPMPGIIPLPMPRGSSSGELYEVMISSPSLTV